MLQHGLARGIPDAMREGRCSAGEARVPAIPFYMELGDRDLQETDVKRLLKARRTRWPRPVGAKHLVRRRGNVVYFAAMAKERIGHGDKM